MCLTGFSNLCNVQRVDLSLVKTPASRHNKRVSELSCNSRSAEVLQAPLSSEQRRWRPDSIFMQHPQGLAAPSDQHQINSYTAPAQQYLSNCSRVLVFNEAGQVLLSRSCQVPTDQCLQQLFSGDYCLKLCLTRRHHLLSFRAFNACLGQGKRPCTLVYCLITGAMK